MNHYLLNQSNLTSRFTKIFWSAAAGLFLLVFVVVAVWKVTGHISVSWFDVAWLTVDIITATGFSDAALADLSSSQLMVLMTLLFITALIHLFTGGWVIRKLILSSGHSSFKTIPDSNSKLLVGLIVFLLLMVVPLSGAIFYSSLDGIPFEGIAHRMLFAVFQAVSAIGNAGFDLLAIRMDDIAAERLLIYNIVLAMGVCAGSIGYFVIMDLLHFSNLRVRLNDPSINWMPITRVTLFGNAIVIGCFVCYYLVFSDASDLLMERIFHGIVTSVQARTGGFSVSFSKSMITDSSWILTVMMIIGGVAGGTSGGVKLTTISVVTHGRKGLFRMAVKVIFFVVCFNVLGSVLLVASTSATDFQRTIFLHVSAFSNVGWGSELIVPDAAVQRIVLITSMLTGRIMLPFYIFRCLLRYTTT